MKRRDWLLLFASYAGAPEGLDPIRFQKGLFLFAERSKATQRSKYVFKPYDYGPMSSEIYRDLDALVAEGLLKEVPVPGKRWVRYKPNNRTFREGQRILEQAEAERFCDDALMLYEIKRDVARMSFSDLLETVYAQHPEMAVNSIFRSRSNS
jgi:uncharacterized protein